VTALLAHAISGRSDLPLPLPLFIYGAGFALVASFVALRALWGDPHLAAAADGRAAPKGLDAAVRVASVVLHVVGLLGFVVVLGAALFGAADSTRNIAPVAVYVVFWVGLQLLSALLGDVWRPLSPFETLGRALARWLPADDGPSHHWPAAAMLLGFAWLELAYHSPAQPRVVAAALVVYSAVLAIGLLRVGPRWLRMADGFGVLFSFISLIAPVFRGDDGRLRFRVPFSGLATLRPIPGTVAVIEVALGATAFDGTSRSAFWRNLTAGQTGWSRTATATVGLLAVTGAVVIAYELACSQITRFTSGPRRDGAPDRDDDATERFAHSLIPIALAYAIAHYFSAFVFEVQSAYALASDPFGRSWDLFGTAARTIDYSVISSAGIAYVQAGAIVVGHVAGVVIAHDRAVEDLPPKAAARSQYPLLAVMVAYTVAGLALLLGA
jgi:hypothetical protein